MVKEIESLTEDERRALRGSKFAPLPRLSSQSKSRLAHPGGPLATNKAAALAKFLERKLKEPDGLASINPDILELAVNNAKQTVYSSNTCGTSNLERSVRHVDSFGDSDAKDSSEEEQNEQSGVKERKKKRKKKKKEKKKKKKRKDVDDPGCAVVKKSKQKFKF